MKKKILEITLSYMDASRCGERAMKLCDRRKDLSSFAHLKPAELRRLRVLSLGVKLKGLIDTDDADEIAADIHDEFPWMARATDNTWQSMRLSAERGIHVRHGRANAVCGSIDEIALTRLIRAVDSA